MTLEPFVLLSPVRRTSPVVFASPHSGRAYDAVFGSEILLNSHTIRSSEDAFVDHLFDSVVTFGAPLLLAQAPRAYVDLNRGPDELDSALIDGVRKVIHNPRVQSGLGVIPRVVAGGRAIYRGKLSLAEAQHRLDRYWHPYHRTLNALMDDGLRRFGTSILIDCHSMPQEAIESVRVHGQRPDVVIGDRFGASASAEMVDKVARAFRDAGFTVAHNTPFAGAYCTIAYGRPSRGQHAIQIEINRSLYMDEARIEPRADFDQVKSAISHAASAISDLGQRRGSLAAE